MNLQTTSLAKVLIIAPWLVISFMLGGIYATCLDNEWSLSTIYDYSISSLGRLDSPDRWLFGGGFTISSLIITASVWIKARILIAFWEMKLSMIVNACFATMGCIMLMIMGWTPNDLDNKLHLTGACGGIILLLLAQSVDTFNWYRFCKYTNKMSITVYITSLYSVVCIVCAISFFMAWMFADILGMGVSKPWTEWMGLLFIILGYLLQSIHGVHLYRVVQVRDDLLGPLILN